MNYIKKDRDGLELVCLVWLIPSGFEPSIASETSLEVGNNFHQKFFAKLVKTSDKEKKNEYTYCFRNICHTISSLAIRQIAQELLQNR